MSVYGNAPEVTPDTWIVVKNWQRFQHYRDRDPLWIKNYTDLLKNDDYLALSMASRGLLHVIWLAYAAKSCHVRVKDVSRLCHRSASYYQLIALNHAGFIEFTASEPIAQEIEIEKEVVKGPKRADAEGQCRAAVLDLASDWNSGNSEDFFDALDALQHRFRVRLRESERDRFWEIAFKSRR